MSRSAKRSSTSTSPGGGDAADPENKTEAPKDGREEPGGILPAGTTEDLGGGGQTPAAAPEAEPCPKKLRRLRIPVAAELKERAQLSEADTLFIAEVTYLREQHEWSQEELADMVGVRRGTVQHYEHHRRGLSLWLAVSLSVVCGSSVDKMIDSGRVKKNLPEFKRYFPGKPK